MLKRNGVWLQLACPGKAIVESETQWYMISAKTTVAGSKVRCDKLMHGSRIVVQAGMYEQYVALYTSC